MAKLKRVECLGGPLDGRWISKDETADSFVVNLNPLVTHRYVIDEQHTGKGVRTIYRHSGVRGTEIKRKK
jgi:hypothetical protein